VTVKAVLDTNIIVSALFSPDGKPFEILDMAFQKNFELVYSSEIMEEYEEVLFRPKFDFGLARILDVLDAVRFVGILASPERSAFEMPDETDRKFYDAAVSCGALLVTGNLRHYPDEHFIVSPADFLSRLAP
jgi:putative PIN family toxin of toxin-antitoxin system